ncbi:hypothetical protein APHAL10511_002156 [Amanita phalloides]|nr:hypothetical protein APHAL10511_002156 [Amanita phalloides]
MPFASLPYELVFHIATYLSKHNLLSLATTTHYLSLIAQHLLYRDLHVGTPSHNLSLVITLAKKPHIAAHVRSFALHIEPTTILFRSFYDALRTALSNMSELTSLQLFLDSNFSSPFRSTDVDLPSRSPSPAFDHHIPLCLPNPLLDLDFLPIMDDIGHSLHSLPNFGKFAVPFRTWGMSSGHSVPSSLRPNSSNILESVAAKLVKMTVPVILFEANIDSLSIPFLLSLSQAMPRLRYVRFTATSNNVEPPSNEFCDDISKILSFFPVLESFELWGIHFEQTRLLNDCGIRWKAKIFGSEIVELHSTPPADLFSDDFMVY